MSLWNEITAILAAIAATLFAIAACERGGASLISALGRFKKKAAD